MKKQIKFLKKYQLIIFLAVIAGLLLSFKVLFAPDQQSSEEPSPTPKPTSPLQLETTVPTKSPSIPITTTTSPRPTTTTISPTLAPAVSPSPTIKISPQPTTTIDYGKGITEEEFVEESMSKYPLLTYLPYEEKEGVHIKYVDTLTLEITKEGSITAEDKEEILNWIEDQGVDPDTHEVRWTVK